MFGKMIVAAAVGLLLIVVPAVAEQRIEVQIPFDFAAGSTNMEAGDYEVTFPLNGAVLLQRSDRKGGAFVMTHATGGGITSATNKLVFHRYGERYFLRQIWSAGYAQGRELRASKAELELARGKPAPGPQVAVVLSK
jgi:hypothetical protein